MSDERRRNSDEAGGRAGRDSRRSRPAQDRRGATGERRAARPADAQGRPGERGGSGDRDRRDDRRSGGRDGRDGNRDNLRDDRRTDRRDDRREGGRGERRDDRRADGRGDRRDDQRAAGRGDRRDDRRDGGRGDRRDDRAPRPRRADQPRGGRPSDHDRSSGPRLTPKSPRKPEPAIREGVTGHEVDRGVKNQLRTLSKENAEGVAQHLVMVAELLDVEPEAALAHAETAVRRAGRVPAAREALGLVAYRMGDWARALTEFRTVRRLSGSHHLLPLMVDCERALGRHAKALELAQSEETETLAIDDRVELAIVVSGIRRDLGQLDAAAAGLTELVRRLNPNRPSAARLYYAYADAKLAAGDAAEAREWFARAADADHELMTDAAERLDELDGVEVVDLWPEGETEGDTAGGTEGQTEGGAQGDPDVPTGAGPGPAQQ